MAKNDKNINGEIDELWQDFQANMSAALYVITEQHALIGRLLEELVRVGALNNDALMRITDTQAEPDSMTSIYTDLYKRYAGYVLLSKRFMDKKDEDK